MGTIFSIFDFLKRRPFSRQTDNRQKNLELHLRSMILTLLETAFVSLLVVTVFFYALFEWRMFRALGKVHIGHSIRNPLPSVSILVSARNEEAGISQTLDSLMKQLYNLLMEYIVFLQLDSHRYLLFQILPLAFSYHKKFL